MNSSQNEEIQVVKTQIMILQPNIKKLLILTWAFSWRWLILGMIIFGTIEKLKKNYGVLEWLDATLYIGWVHVIVFYICLKLILRKKFKNFRLVIINASE